MDKVFDLSAIQAEVSAKTAAATAKAVKEAGLRAKNLRTLLSDFVPAEIPEFSYGTRAWPLGHVLADRLIKVLDAGGYVIVRKADDL